MKDINKLYMKVLQINVTCGHGSTGVIATEIAERLEYRGHEAYIAYGQGTTSYLKSYKIGSKFENKLHALIYTRILGKEGYGTYVGTKKFLKWVDFVKPDIIQVHNLHSNFLNFPMFFKYVKEKNIPIVYSLFDCWAFTGKCTHFTEEGCRKWETQCGNCPQLKNSGPKTWFFDRTQSLYKVKKNLFTSLPSLNIIVCSNWLKREVKKSFLSKYPIHMIYNWIDTKKFKEWHDDSIYSRYGLDKNKKILVSVSAIWNDMTTRYTDALRLAEILPDDYQLVIVGNLTSKRIPRRNIVHINFVHGTDELSKLYSAALAFVGFSVEDTFGKVFAEAMLCGTPAVVFNATACPEVVGDIGYVVEPHNVVEMLDKVNEISKNGRLYYSERCKQHVIKNYNYDINVGKYIDLYESILGNRS